MSACLRFAETSSQQDRRPTTDDRRPARVYEESHNDGVWWRAMAQEYTLEQGACWPIIQLEMML
ncbi:hypothetical protein N7504_006329 [Penicillium tannophilum]|nr:hypothetical protein N7504_006329 [Penicillium tannophilum]